MSVHNKNCQPIRYKGPWCFSRPHVSNAMKGSAADDVREGQDRLDYQKDLAFILFFKNELTCVILLESQNAVASCLMKYHFPVVLFSHLFSCSNSWFQSYSGISRVYTTAVCST